MADKLRILADKRTQLAEIRTELAYRRTISADLRTTATMVLFGVAFLGFAEEKGSFFMISGAIAILVGIVFLLGALNSWMLHSKQISLIKVFFDKMLKAKK